MAQTNGHELPEATELTLPGGAVAAPCTLWALRASPRLVRPDVRESRRVRIFLEVLQGQGPMAISSQPPLPLPWLLNAVGHQSVASPSNHKALGQLELIVRLGQIQSLSSRNLSGPNCPGPGALRAERRSSQTKTRGASRARRYTSVAARTG